MAAAGTSSPRFDFALTTLLADHGSLRGDRKLGVRDWESLRSSPLLDGRLTLRAMTSMGSLIDREGMPSLLQTGGVYRHAYVHDRQHPHDLLMEAAANVRLGMAWLYIAPVGAPALGPPVYMHRPSAAADPIAPIGHHWQDASHVSYGVVSLGAAWRGAVFEASAFNARESDYESAWPEFSRGRLDSFASRASLARGPAAVSAWWGYLKSHDPIVRAMQMHRFGASVSFDRDGFRGGRWSSLAVWGMNAHHHDGSSHALLHGDSTASPHVRSSSLLLESNLDVGSRTTVFSRIERVMKSGEELGFLGGDLMSLHEVRTLVVGGRRDLRSSRYVKLSGGVRGVVAFLPSSLDLAYGTRRPRGIDVFFQARRAP